MGDISSRQTYRKLWGSIAVLVCVGLLGGVIYALADYYSSTDDVENFPSETPNTILSSTTTKSCDYNASVTQGSPLDYYGMTDGLDIGFAHGTNTLDEMEAALQNEFVKMIEGDVTLYHYGMPTQTSEPIMAHPPEVDSDNTLNNWLSEIFSSDKALKMDIKTEEVIPYALEELRHTCDVHQPVWINIDAVQGPNSAATPISADVLIKNVNQFFPNLTLSLGWTTGYRYAADNEQYTWDNMDEMLSIAQSTHQPVTFPVRAALAQESWDRFLWLVDQDEDRFTLTVWSASTDPVSIEKKMFLRDNFDHRRMFYDTSQNFVEDIIKETVHRTVPKNFYSGGNVLDYYEIQDRNAIKITWDHAVNNEAKLLKAVADPTILMLEADVRSYGEGTANLNTSLPVMSHNPGPETTHTITFEEWINLVITNSTKGIKLDFKSLGALKPSLDILNKYKDQLKIPVWLNADIMQGPNMIETSMNGTAFLETINMYFPHATISPGWVTAYNPAPNANSNVYTQEMVEKMYDMVKQMRQAITFPIRASLAQPSIKQLQWLLNKSDRYTLTIWYSTSEELTTDALMEVYHSFEKNKVYYDLPEDTMTAFLNAIENE